MEQLKELESEEFEQLCAVVGMDKKPFHIMRLKKALNKHTTSTTSVATAKKPRPPATPTSAPASSINNTPSLATPFSQQSTASSVATTNLGKSPADEHPLSGSSSSSISTAMNSDPSPAHPLAPNKAFLEAMKKADESFSSPGSVSRPPSGIIALSGQTDDKLKNPLLPSYLQENSSDSGDLSELIDDQTPVQKTLGPCPFQPSMWDPERRELIRKYAIIYGKNFNKRQKELLTPFEEQVNEGAFQLCLRDPTLLVRREELFILAKRAIKEGGYTYYHGYGKGKDLETTTLATTGQKRPHPRESIHLGIPAPKMIITSELVDEMPKKMSGRMRQERMNELEKMIVANKTQQAAKLVELEQAQQLCNFSSAFSIQLEVESLGNACQQLQTSYAALKRKQRRSDRYFTLKEREAMAEGNEMFNGGKARQQHSASSQEGVSPTNALYEDDYQQDTDSSISRQQSMRKSFKLKDSSKKPQPQASVTAMVIPGISSSQGNTTTTPTQAGRVVTTPITTPLMEGSSEGEDREVQDLVKNVSHATDEVNSLMIREFQKQLVWDPINT